MSDIRKHAAEITNHSIKSVLPEAAVENCLSARENMDGEVVIAIGKAAWNMARAAGKVLGGKIGRGLVITKYAHSNGGIDGFEIIEAGHPIPDENSIRATRRAIELVEDLEAGQEVILLISGGGSALFEKPIAGLELGDIIEVTDALLRSGADIVEMNTVRKHLSGVKGGRFAKICEPAGIFAVVLSDVLGDRLDSIASGPTFADSSTSEEALAVMEKYGIPARDAVFEALKRETPKDIGNCDAVTIGSVRLLCAAAADKAEELGYRPYILTSGVTSEARQFGSIMASIAAEIKRGTARGFTPPCAIVAGGETIVKVRGSGKGGRNQEIALSAAMGIEGLPDALIFSFGSDGTDGPTDAAGGIADGGTVGRLRAKGIIPERSLEDNDAYNALKETGDLIITGPTGANVNDVTVLLIGD